MLNSKGGLIRSSRWAVRTAVLANRLFFLAVLLGLILSWILRMQFAALVTQGTSAVDVQSKMTGLRLLMLLGAGMALATEILLTALAQIIASAGVGDPFIAVNAQRLRTIGWALLTLQLLDLTGAWLAKVFPSLGSAAPDVTFFPGGWIAVLMVFVLSRVFTAGSAMRDEIEGTV